MSTTVLPELAAESIETAERLTRLSVEERLDAAEAEYILASGVASIQNVPRLWRIIRKEICAGTTGARAQQLLTRLLDAVDRNLTLAVVLKKPTRIVREETALEPEAVAGLAEVEEQFLAIRAEAVRLLKVVEAPARWPGEKQLKEAKAKMQRGDRLSAEEFRRVLLEE
ncbi:MAG: hypothetical protein ACYC3I_05630 [Gemmataceae bacterium]